MAEYVLENDVLKVVVASKGCELISVVRKADGREFLWNANPDAWKRHAPVLFPLIGRYKNDESIHDGVTYHMTQHGFARDMEFELVSQNDTEIWMKLEDTAGTREKYPFAFVLCCGYQLVDNCVKVLWKVHNPNEQTMYFSIGGHPAFVGSGSSLKDAKICFNNPKSPLQYGLLNENGLLLDDLYDVELDDNHSMQLCETFFDRDALVFENSMCKEISIVENEKTVVTVKFDAPVFGIWSAAKKNVPFVCIEPWYGRTDRAGFDGKLSNREWGNALESGKTFEADYDLIFAKD